VYNYYESLYSDVLFIILIYQKLMEEQYIYREDKMSIFSHSSRGHHYRNGNLGSGYYQRRGVMGRLFGMLGSGHHSCQYNTHYPPQNNYPQGNVPTPNWPATICRKCNSKIPSGSKFCPECGEIIRDDLCCTNCGARLRQNSKFCTNCGNKVNG